MVQPGDPPWRSRTALRAELIESGAIVPVEVDGIKGERFVLAGELAILDDAEAELAAGLDPGGQPPGAAFLAPLDPFVWDRELLRSLYDFDYVWEVYVPEKKRRWGYYVLPILFGDRLVGRIEPRIDRKSGALRVLGLWWEAGLRSRWRRPASSRHSRPPSRPTGGSEAFGTSLLPTDPRPSAVRGRRPRAARLNGVAPSGVGRFPATTIAAA